MSGKWRRLFKEREQDNSEIMIFGRLRVLRKVKLAFIVCLLLVVMIKVWMLIKSTRSYNNRTLPSSNGEKLRGQQLIDYIATNLRVAYVIDILGVRRIRFTNNGLSDIPHDEPWVIYFNHAGDLGGHALLKLQGLRLFHVDGWLNGIETELGFMKFQGIPAGDSLTLNCIASLKTKSYAFPRWYVAGEPSSRLEPRIITSTDSESLDFVESPTPVWSAAERYSANELMGDNGKMDDLTLHSQDGVIVPIVPTPLNSSRFPTNQRSTVRLGPKWTIDHTNELTDLASYLADKLKMKTGADNKANVNQIRLRLQNITTQFHQFPYIRSLDEAYVLQVEQDNVLIEGHTSTGVFYGIQSLLSLLERSSNHVSLPVITITDAPRMPFRGLLLDVARNFIQKKDLFKIMDVMAMYKMNRLHLHLTDDQGWRFEVPGLPELTQIGGRRSHDVRQHSSLYPYFGSGPLSTNPIGTGYYSVDDYRAILRHASKSHIKVVPEIDMPGHAHAAIQSMRVRHADSRKRDEFLLSDPDDESVYKAVNEQQDTVINPCLDSSFAFVERVLRALKGIHRDVQPLEVVHLGGDEVPQEALIKSPLCKRFVVEHPEWRNRFKLYFMLRVERIASRLGLQLQAWEDGLLEKDGKPIALDKWNGSSIHANTYNNNRAHQRGDLAFALANSGYKVILTHATHLYIDHPSEPDGEELGLSWAAPSVSTRKVFEYIVPVDDQRVKVKVSSLVKDELCNLYGMSECFRLTAPENIIGLQVSLWGEMVRTIDQVEYMLYPRLLSAAERAWHVADWETTAVDRADFDRRRQADWRRFASVVGQVELARLERMGVRYRVPPPGVRYERKQLLVNIELPGLPVLYSTDGGSSWVKLPETSSLDISTISPSVGYILFIARSHDQSRTSRSVRVQWPPDDN